MGYEQTIYEMFRSGDRAKVGGSYLMVHFNRGYYDATTGKAKTKPTNEYPAPRAAYQAGFDTARDDEPNPFT